MNNRTERSIALDAGGTITALVYHARHPSVGAALVLAHGAGAGQLSPFMTGFARALASLGLDTITFNFPYAEQRRRLPDRPSVLEACYRTVIDMARDDLASATRFCFIGGKSMGGRIATQVAATDGDLPVDGVVLLGYPLHPPGRPAERRDAHLPAVGRPMLFVQGDRDPFGSPAELEPLVRSLSSEATLHIVSGGDHSFKVPRGGNQAAVYEEVQRKIVEWVQRIIAAGGRESLPPQR